MGDTATDMAGLKVHRWTVIRRAHRNNSRQANWLCRCECGTEKVIAGSTLRFGASKSCGCLRVDVSSKINLKHGLSKSPIYRLWRDMLNRCNLKTRNTFPRYGGRGIEICDRWMSFDNFLADMGERPDGLTLERRNNNEGYSPENCYWATVIEQANNKRNNRMVIVDGKMMTMAQASRHLSIPYPMFRKRVRKGTQKGVTLCKE